MATPRPAGGNPAPKEEAQPARGAGETRSLLIVEDDKVASRYLELALTRAGGYRLEVAQDVAGAMEILSTTKIDLVLTDIYLPDTDAFQFYRRARRESRFRTIPFIFVSADTKIATKVNALSMGVDDYITKPFDVQELRARVEAAIQRIAAGRADQSRRRYNLAGDFTGISFTDLIYLLEIGRRNGALSIVTSHAAAELRFRDGAVITATFGNLQGEEAFYRIMAEPEGVFEFQPGDVPIEESASPITQSSTALLLEGARRKDDTTRIVNPLAKSENRPATDTEVLTLSKAPDVPEGGTIPAVAATPELAAQFEEGVSDSFSLGELQLFTEESLRDWTRSNTHPERLHIHLVADLEEGVSALMSMAAPVTDSQVYTTLTTPVVTLGLVFYLRKERMVDLILIDQESPGAMLEPLQRHPGVMIIAPRRGDFLSLGVNPQVGLVSVLQKIPPGALMGLGNASTDDGLAQIQSHAKTAIPSECMRTSLAEAGGDMREVVLAAIRLWGKAGSSKARKEGGAA